MNVLLIFTTMFLLMFLGTDIFVSMGMRRWRTFW